MREVGRKIVHLGVGTTLLLGAIYLQANYSIREVYLYLFVWLIASLIVDFLIADWKWKVPIYDIVGREKERTGFHASTHMLLGIFVAFVIFDFDIALASVGMLVYGDAFAALIGRKFGTPFYRNKSIAGSSAMLIVSLIVCAYFVPELAIVAVMAIVGMLIEVFVKHVDDNIMIPVFSGLVAMLLRYFLF